MWGDANFVVQDWLKITEFCTVLDACNSRQDHSLESKLVKAHANLTHTMSKNKIVLMAVIITAIHKFTVPDENFDFFMDLRQRLNLKFSN